MTNKLSNILRNKPFPNKKNILFVYSIIAYIVYSWTLITFFYKLPSWINYLKINEIAVIFAYSMSTDALESLLFLGEIILLYYLLSPVLFKYDFQIHGTWLAISFIGTLMVYFLPFSKSIQMTIDPGFWILFSILFAILFSIIPSHVKFFRTVAIFLSERTTIFLWIFSFLSIISLLVLGIRLLVLGYVK
jgi:hypothetical protein